MQRLWQIELSNLQRNDTAAVEEIASKRLWLKPTNSNNTKQCYVLEQGGSTTLMGILSHPAPKEHANRIISSYLMSLPKAIALILRRHMLLLYSF